MLRMVVKLCMGESCRAEAGEDGASGCEECAQHDGMSLCKVSDSVSVWRGCWREVAILGHRDQGGG